MIAKIFYIVSVMYLLFKIYNIDNWKIFPPQISSGSTAIIIIFRINWFVKQLFVKNKGS